METDKEKLTFFKSTATLLLDYLEYIVKSNRKVSAPDFVNFQTLTNKICEIAAIMHEKGKISAEKLLETNMTAEMTIQMLSLYVDFDFNSVKVLKGDKNG